jgi:hypothetical protein
LRVARGARRSEQLACGLFQLGERHEGDQRLCHRDRDREAAQRLRHLEQGL